jgi:crotonobetainyl-CoA:carnitine CoA-transferase CaiB-like acyl-CoA transferase
VGDIISGTHAAVGILAALHYREKTGRGQHVDISMIDSLFSTLENAVVRYTISGEIPTPLGGIQPSITPFQGYQTADSWIIAAIGINSIKEICEDPHIAYRRMLVEIDQPIVGKMRIANSAIRMSETPGEVYAPAPVLGQHTDEVLQRVLGYSPEQIAALKDAGVINRSVD